jgi:CRISPR-associated helicase Cas3/CRISPR-associated endonuclease Cas3-HD
MNQVLDLSSLVSKRLLSKWRMDREDFRRARGFLWAEHTQEVLQSAHFLFTTPYSGYQEYPSFGAALFDMMNLSKYANFEQFERWFYLTCLAHDFGKAGGEFQYMMHGLEENFRRQCHASYTWPPTPSDLKPLQRWQKEQPRYRQRYRHETLSALLLCHHPQIREWFQREVGSQEGWGYIIAATLGHHLRLEPYQKDWDFPEEYIAKPIFLAKLSEEIQKISFPQSVAPFPTLEDIGTPHGRGSPLARVATVSGMERVYREMELNPLFSGSTDPTEDTPISVALKWLLIIADTLGSIDAKSEEKAEDTRNRVFLPLLDLFSPSVSDHTSRILRGMDKKEGDIDQINLRDWQEAMAVDHNVIASIATGQGKTIGALWWATRAPHLRVLFCGTTTDAVTALRNQYGDPKDHLKHHRSELDRQRALDAVNAADALSLSVSDEEVAEQQKGKLDEKNDEIAKHADEEISAFRGYSSEVTFTTADVVLGPLTFYRSAILWLPYLLKSQVVFDEVHSFDTTMRGWHERFMTWFPKIRTAHLSATIPESLLGDLTRLATCNKVAPLVIRTNLKDESVQKKRLRIHLITEEEAQLYFRAGTIWFVNTVGRCQEWGKNLLDTPGTVLYHSRFKQEDRRRIRDQILKDFDKVGDHRCRILATQVAEMSLNISSLGGLSEVAPPEAVIQRLGRINRFGAFGVVDVYFYMPTMKSGLPYSTHRDSEVWCQDYAEWIEWIRQFHGAEVSSADLEDAFQRFYRDRRVKSQRNAYSTLLGTFRRSSREQSPTVSILRYEDIKGMPKNIDLSWAQLNSVPALYTGLEFTGQIIHHFKVARGTKYDSQLGLLQSER